MSSEQTGLTQEEFLKRAQPGKMTDGKEHLVLGSLFDKEGEEAGFGYAWVQAAKDDFNVYPLSEQDTKTAEELRKQGKLIIPGDLEDIGPYHTGFIVTT